jgi:hypothetical protein
VREVSGSGQPPHGKAELGLPCEAAKPQEMRVDHALGKIEAQSWHDLLF